MKLVVWKNNLGRQILYKIPDPRKKTAPFPNQWDLLGGKIEMFPWNRKSLVVWTCPAGNGDS